MNQYIFTYRETPDGELNEYTVQAENALVATKAFHEHVKADVDSLYDFSMKQQRYMGETD